tara:strand:- start:1391 stop:1732 length:342 start_codon:yes stop_codon:yes gene_type:complete
MPDSQTAQQVDTSQVDTSQVETSSSSPIGHVGIFLLIVLIVVLIVALLFVVVKYLMPFLWVDHKNNDSDHDNDKYKKLEDRVTKLEGNNNDEDKGKPNHMGRTPRTSATQKRT